MLPANKADMSNLGAITDYTVLLQEKTEAQRSNNLPAAILLGGKRARIRTPNLMLFLNRTFTCGPGTVIRLLFKAHSNQLAKGCSTFGILTHLSKMTVLLLTACFK